MMTPRKAREALSVLADRNSGLDSEAVYQARVQALAAWWPRQKQAWESTASLLEHAWQYALDPEHSLDASLTHMLEAAGDELAVGPARWPVSRGYELVLRPRDVVSRSWLELYLMLRRDLRPVRCGWCGHLFPPTDRSPQSFCPGTTCRQQANASKATPWRTEYQKMAKRWERGTITREELEAWRRDNPNPRTPPKEKA
jgi:hypothetical protein